jgi:hypothetical protein
MPPDVVDLVFKNAGGARHIVENAPNDSREMLGACVLTLVLGGKRLKDSSALSELCVALLGDGSTGAARDVIDAIGADTINAGSASQPVLEALSERLANKKEDAEVAIIFGLLDLASNRTISDRLDRSGVSPRALLAETVDPKVKALCIAAAQSWVNEQRPDQKIVDPP